MGEPADSKFRTILHVGWHGLCPRCGKGTMFQSWLKISDTCDTCGLDYKFASPDDGPAFFSLCFVAFPLLFILIGVQAVFDLSVVTALVIAIPLMSIGCVLPLRPFKGWLVASQYLNQATEAGTEKLWNELNDGDSNPRDNAQPTNE